MVVACDPADADAVIASAARAGVPGWRLGAVRAGTGRVVLA
jgi:hypothetical protein